METPGYHNLGSNNMELASAHGTTLAQITLEIESQLRTGLLPNIPKGRLLLRFNSPETFR